MQSGSSIVQPSTDVRKLKCIFPKTMKGETVTPPTSPHANSFVLGPAVINSFVLGPAVNTHTGTAVINTHTHTRQGSSVARARARERERARARY